MQVIRNDLGDGVVRLVLNRAPVNALTPPFLMEFASVLDALAEEDGVRAVVLQSAFKVYSAGLDLKAAQSFSPEDQNAIVDALNIGFLAQYRFPKPLVAAVNGAAIAGGLFFVLAADWRVSGPAAQFGLAEVRVGADFPIGPMEIARAELDPGDLRRLMLTGQPFPAPVAAARGIVDHLCDAEEVEEAALAKARELAALPLATFGRVKAQIRAPAIATIEVEMERLKTDPNRGWFDAETKSAMKRMIG
ncbi:MAG: enoyl-CoA hydratase/isomerase family protein [Paracoccaceae bacterium]